MAEAYKLKSDASIARVLRVVEGKDGEPVEIVQGEAYAAGDYVFARNMKKLDRERAENGELSYLLEPVSLEEAESALADDSDQEVFAPEHEVERYALLDMGYSVLERDQVIRLNSSRAGNFNRVVGTEATIQNRPAVQQAVKQPTHREVEAEPVKSQKSGKAATEEKVVDTGRDEHKRKSERKPVSSLDFVSRRGVRPKPGTEGK